ncbi:sensor histidine kinase [Alishewanella tabrizica]|uniref:histidine kinase n=1 Tax=Alishewanella tabrizica TaxID=671278 RepID=A0ABQ2WIZ2_9ALTE|nr:ATP-binding protein [Alishewanella tabrizica]GGW53272.1 hypothetical protein GCM10008111_06800 [Alishewanella tabrizica]
MNNPSREFTGATSRFGQPHSKSVWVGFLILFCISAITLNYIRIPLFFGVEFIFGSSLAVLALVILGYKGALIVAASAALLTWFLWEHPYAFVIFTLEMVWLGWRWSTRKNTHLVIQDIIFWLLMGLPMVLIFYVYFVEVSFQTASNIWLKQMTNGVFNTLVAAVLIMLIQAQPVLSKRFDLPPLALKQILFNSLMALTFLAGAVPLFSNARQLQSEYEAAIAQRLLLIAEITARHLNSGVASEALIPAYLTALLPDQNSGIAIFDDAQNLKFSVGTITKKNTEKNTEKNDVILPMQLGFSRWQPEEAITLDRLKATRYFYILSMDALERKWFIKVEQGSAEALAKLQRDSTAQLSLLVGFMFFAVLLSVFLSRLISAPFQHLTQASKTFKNLISGNETLHIPQSNLAEYNALADVLRSASIDISQAFNEGKTLQAGLSEELIQRNNELHHANSQLEAILTAASDFSIIATDQEGLISYFSPGAEKLTGYTAAEMVQLQTPAILHLNTEVDARAAELSQEYQQLIIGFKAFVIVAEQQGSESREWHYVRKDRQQILVSLTVTPIQDNAGMIRGYLGIAKDISERHRNEKLKNEFISTVSHELRTPLTSIYGALRLVNSGTLAELPPKVAKLLRVAEENSQRLSVLINDLLDIEKLLAGKMQLSLQVMAIVPIVEDAIQTISSYAEQFNVKIEAIYPTKTLYANVDSMRLMQVIHNLLSNAIKFSAAGNHVTVKVSEDHTSIKLEVIDQGMGIPEEFKARIFERFTQSDAASTRKQGGTGLGLAISKELTLKMGGDIGFVSELRHGTTFWLTFPLVLSKDEDQ